MKSDPTWWDPYSCQPYKLTKDQKPRLTTPGLIEYAKVLATTLALAPALLWKFGFQKHGVPCAMRDFAGLGVNSEPEWRDAHRELIEEIGVRNLMLRVPIWQLDRLDETIAFLELFPDHDFLVNILQDRESVISPDLWRSRLKLVFDALTPLVNTFQIGNAVNRTKWGCRHSADALMLFKIADEVRAAYPGTRLLGSSVIDFEPLVTQRTLFNFEGFHYDGCASLLYINRRGSAYGKQYGYFNLERKLRLIRSIVDLSNTTDKELWITETNWPLLDTKPYTPNSGHPRSTVDEQTQAEYLRQYYDIANKTGWVERVYWWQLINPGYGLVDHRGNRLRRMPSFYAFKDLFAADGKP